MTADVARVRNRLTLIEHSISAYFGRISRFIYLRAGAFIISLIYLLLLWKGPTQLVDVLRSNWAESGILTWVFLLVPVVVAAVAHLALVPSKYELKSRADRWLVLTPQIALTLMAARWVPGALLVAVPLLMFNWLIIVRLMPRIANARQKWCRYVVATTLSLFVICVIAFQLWPQSLPVALGPAFILTLGLGIIGLVIAIAMLRPVVGCAYLIVCLFAAYQFSGSTPVPLIDNSQSAGAPASSMSEGIYKWVRERGDLKAYQDAGKPYPLIIAAAEGGGIYAAAHSYLTLSAMGIICPNFRQHLFATVGVSGGAVGTLFYAAQRNGGGNPTAVQPCEHGKVDIDTEPLTTDLLSPTLANLLFLGTADFLIPGPSLFRDGGDTLANSIASLDPGNTKITAPLGASWRPAGTDPATLFVATDVSTGYRFVLSPLTNAAGPGVETFPTGNTRYDISANSAAVISARFPFLTSTARLNIDKGDARILADGGYFENSGSDTSLALIEEIRTLGRRSTSCVEDQVLMVGDGDACRCPLIIASSFKDDVQWSGCAIHIAIIYVPMAGAVDGLLGYSYGKSPDPAQSYFGDPFSTILRARGARDQFQAIRARAAFNVDDPEGVGEQSAGTGYFPQELAIDDLNLPLGWKLSKEAANKILTLSAPTRACLAQRLDGSAEPASVTGQPIGDREATRAEVVAYDNGCNMRMLASVFDPTGKKPGIAIPGY